MLVIVAAFVFGIAAAVALVFQVGLALGMPWGAYAMGGRFPGTFPPRMRAAAIIQAALLIVIALVVLARAGLIPAGRDLSQWLVWGVVGISAVSVALNVMTPSTGERRIWAPVSIVLFTCSLIVALN
jgi:hypothetical protein